MSLAEKIQRSMQPVIGRLLIPKMADWEARIREKAGVIRGGPRSAKRFNILEESFRLTGEHPRLPGFPDSLRHVLGSVRNIRRSVFEVDRNPADGKTQISDEELRALRNYAKEIGVDEIGFAEVPQEWVFEQTAILGSHAIVLVWEMDKERMNLAPHPQTAVMVHQTYNELGVAANKIANWLRERGFATHAGHPLNGMALYPPLAEKAGLGGRGMSGLLLTPQFGPRVRLAAVFTEIENLPVYAGSEHDWVLDYCELCKRCVKDCPPQAFYDGPRRHENGLVTVLDNEKCFPYFAKNHGCSICIKVCPFHQDSYSNLKAKLKAEEAPLAI